MNKGAFFSIVATLVFAFFASLFSAANVYSQSAFSITLTPFDCDTITRAVQLSDEIVAVLFGNIDLVMPEDDGNADEIALQLQPGVDDVECDEPVQPLLILQRISDSGAASTSTVIVNGNPVEFDGTVAFQLLPDLNNLQLMVLNGSASADDVEVEARFTIQILLAADGTEPLGVWVGNRPLSDDDLPNLDEVSTLFETAVGDIAIATPSCVVSTSSPRYIIQAGDTLSGIASRASTTLNEVMRLNCMTNVNALIIAGNPLYVPRIPIPRPTATITPSMTFTITFAPAATDTFTPTFTATFPGTQPAP